MDGGRTNRDNRDAQWPPISFLVVWADRRNVPDPEGRDEPGHRPGEDSLRFAPRSGYRRDALRCAAPD